MSNATATACDCLTSDDSSLPHAARCAAFAYGDFEGGQLDTTDIRELAELAANTDIDTALHILRKHRASTAR